MIWIVFLKLKLGHSMQAERTKPVIEVNDLHKSFGEFKVIDGVSLDTNENEVISLIGGSGSGKSTILRCISLLSMPDAGEIYVDGQRMPLSQPSRKKNRVVTDTRRLRVAREQIGMVFQQFNLWSHLTVMQNIIEGPMCVKRVTRQDAIATAEELLVRVGMADKRNAYPSMLSGGQQQRVAIARTLAMKPRVILFDEPTSALDPEMVGEVLQVILDLADEGRSMIVVTHEIGFAREVSNRILFLNTGKIVEEGPAEQIVDNPQSVECQQFLANFK